VDVPGSVLRYVVIQDGAFGDYTYPQLEGRFPSRSVIVWSEARQALGLQIGSDALERAEHVSRLFFSGELSGLSVDELLDVLDDAPSSEITRHEVADGGFELAALLHHAGLSSSKGDGKRSIEGGGIYLGGRKISDRDYKITMADSVEGRLFLLRKGKKQYHVVKIV
jgi:tyrosyl-tRNA synthetase